MKLVTYAGPTGEPQLGVLRGNLVHDVPGMRDVLDAIDAGDARLLDGRASPTGRPLSEVKLLAPVVKPRRNVMCIGRNYKAHIEETGSADSDWPAVFTKVPEAVIGPEAGIRLDVTHSTHLDWEGELAVIIGRPGRDIPESEALSHVFGYTCGNDVTLRDVQRRHGGQWFKGKSGDTHCPLGPVLVTADEIGDPQDLDLATRVNGVEKQHSNTKLMIFNIPRIIAELSRGMRLNSGDVIMTGTPDGVGFARNPPEFMKAGDVVEVEISGIGVLRNHVVAAEGD
jgi:2-keto-4-pentenoate hydratase/2-oxohepta-3-ene-1,7-dioic acid hydratase in catechol pathway